jgi:hypothetical protein
VSESPEELVQKLLESGGDSSGTAERLLAAYFGGHPVSTLEPLLRHSNKSIATTAGWILSELGRRGADLVELSVELLSSPFEDVRVDSISNILANSTTCTANHAWAVISVYQKETARVQGEIINYLARAPVDLLQRAIASTTQIAAQRQEIGISLLAPPLRLDRILESLRSEDPIVRAYALAAALRLDFFVQSAWRAAARSDDPVLRSSGDRWLRQKDR